jgi:hypothetical protein
LGGTHARLWDVMVFSSDGTTRLRFRLLNAKLMDSCFALTIVVDKCRPLCHCQFINVAEGGGNPFGESLGVPADRRQWGSPRA